MQIKSHEICTGCSCCLLSCPVWHSTRDRSMTAQGRNKALQGGASVTDIAGAIDSCLLCGACLPACHKGNDIVGLTIEQRRQLNSIRASCPDWYPAPVKNGSRVAKTAAPCRGKTLLAGESLKADVKIREAVIRLLKADGLAADGGGDILAASDAGLPVDSSRVDNFLSPLRPAESLIVADGGMKGYLKEWLPDKKVTGLGEALLSIDAVRKAIGPGDLYVIECRGYHADHARLVRFYDDLRKETGAQFNLDLQRAAIPTGASSLQGNKDAGKAGCMEQARWTLHGRNPGRIIVENLADRDIFRKVTDIPVIHAAELV